MKGVKILNKIFLVISIAIFLILVGCASRNYDSSTTSSAKQGPTQSNTQPIVASNPSLGEPVTECCADTIKDGIVLYGNQISSERHTILDSDGEHAVFDILIPYSGFTEKDVSKVNVYCNNGAKVSFTLMYGKTIPKVIIVPPFYEYKIVIDYNKVLKYTSTDECVLLVNLKNGDTVSKKFNIKLIGTQS